MRPNHLWIHSLTFLWKPPIHSVNKLNMNWIEGNEVRPAQESYFSLIRCRRLYIEKVLQDLHTTVEQPELVYRLVEKSSLASELELQLNKKPMMLSFLLWYHIIQSMVVAWQLLTAAVTFMLYTIQERVNPWGESCQKSVHDGGTRNRWNSREMERLELGVE